MKMEFTALTRPRMSSGVCSCTRDWRITMLTMSVISAGAAVWSERYSGTATDIAQHMEKISAMSLETHGAMQENTTAVADLEQISSRLQQQVSRFRLG